MSAPATLETHEWPPTGADAGAAAPLAVLVHGVTGWWKTWWRVGPALAERGWRVVAVDQRGHGASPGIEAGATLDDLADDLEGAIERQAAPPIDLLIGHSLGAMVAMSLARRRPSITRRLVLEDPPSIDRTTDEAFFASLRAGVRAAREMPHAEIERQLAENPGWVRRDAEQEVEGRAMTDVEGIVASLRRPRHFTVAGAAADLEVPTLYLLADEGRSVLTGPARSRLRGQLPPHGRVLEFDAGHTIHRDRFDDYMAAVLDWVPSPR